MTSLSTRGGSLRSQRILCHIPREDHAPSLARSTRHSSDQTLTRLERELGDDRPLSTLTLEAVTVAVTTAWGGRAPATWNRQVATVRSFLRFCRRRRRLVDDLTVDLERQPEPADRTRAIPLPDLERLWRREDVGVWEKALWRLLYETAARASEALSINVEDVELDNKRVPVRFKGGDTDWLHLQTGATRLLPRLISGWTLHQLRDSALTHLAEQKVRLPLLMAKDRHASLRSLQRYARPGAAAVAMSAATDPAHRRNLGPLE